MNDTIKFIKRMHNGDMKWRRFPHYCPFVMRIHQSLAVSLHKLPVTGYYICVCVCVLIWTSCLTNSRVAGNWYTMTVTVNSWKLSWWITSHVLYAVKPVGKLHWRHNDHDGVSNHQPHGCLLNRLFRRRSKKTPKLRITGLCAGNSPGPVNSPHKGPVTRKMFPFDDVIMNMQWNDQNLPHLIPKKKADVDWDSFYRNRITVTMSWINYYFFVEHNYSLMLYLQLVYLNLSELSVYMMIYTWQLYVCHFLSMS